MKLDCGAQIAALIQMDVCAPKVEMEDYAHPLQN